MNKGRICNGAAFYLMTGMSGSGKTTFAKDFAEKNGLLYLCPDEFYKAFNGDDTANGHRHEFEVWMALWQAIHNAEIDGVSVIVDTNAPTNVDRDQFLNWFPGFQKYILIYIEADAELCARNNRNRKRVVPIEEMKAMQERFESPLDERDYKWDLIFHYENDENVLEIATVIAKENS